jgi:hypothetical protein
MTDAKDGPVSADMLVVQARRAGEGARERIAAAVAVLSLPVHARLSDHQHATVIGLIDRFIAAVETQIRHHMVDDADRAFPPEPEALIASQEPLAAPILGQVGMSRDPALVAAALRRADAHHAAEARAANGSTDPLVRLKESPNTAVAEAATALSIAEHRRIGQFQEPLLIADDLPVELARRIAWRIAASLRRYLLARPDIEPGQCDRRIAAAVVRCLASHDETAAVEARAMRLMERLHAGGAIYDDLIAAAFERGRLTLFVAALAVRAGLDYAEVSDIITDPARNGLIVLLRAIDMHRPFAATILLAVDPDTPAETIERWMAAFEALDPDQARETLRPRQLDPDYRAAIVEIHQGLARAGARR